MCFQAEGLLEWAGALASLPPSGATGSACLGVGVPGLPWASLAVLSRGSKGTNSYCLSGVWRLPRRLAFLHVLDESAVASALACARQRWRVTRWALGWQRQLPLGPDALYRAIHCAAALCSVGVVDLLQNGPRLDGLLRKAPVSSRRGPLLGGEDRQGGVAPISMSSRTYAASESLGTPVWAARGAYISRAGVPRGNPGLHFPGRALVLHYLPHYLATPGAALSSERRSRGARRGSPAGGWR
jgi:hypothetical protein